jgi:quercetin dioxygenase-like cupin family protein
MKRLIASIALIVPLTLLAQAPEVEITSEPSHHFALENEHIRVFKVEVAPHASTLMHRHRHDYMFVTLGDSHVSNEVSGKAPVDLKLSDGETHYAAGNFAHIARNLSDQPFRNVTIELMQDEKLRNAPSPWPTEDGDKDFTGGRVRVLFVHDAARASEIDLQPGATQPSHRHDGPFLVVAITDLDFRSDREGQTPISTHTNAGDIKWLPGGYNHTLTNIGSQPARHVIVEFK